MNRKRKIKKNCHLFKVLIFGLFILLILFLLFLLIKNIFMPNNDMHKFKSHVSDIENAKKKYNTSDYKVSGWLEVENTNINLPIFRAIHKSFEYPVTMEKYGWTLNVDDKYYDFMTVFGHNLMNLGVPKKEDSSFKRFEELMAFSYDDFADSHKYFQYTVDGKEYIYKIFSVSFFDSRTIYKFPLHPGTASLSKKETLELINKNSIYKYDVDVNESDGLLLITTCTRMFGSDESYEIVVSGRLLRGNENANNYKMEKTKNYNKIKKILKGDD